LKTEAGNATHFVVFDACRNTLKLTKAGSRALVQSKGSVPVAQESGMLVAYATAEGELASDVGVGAGPYAMVLAEEIIKPDIEAVTMFRNVQRRVRMATKQEPYLGFSALGDVYLGGPRSDRSKVAARPPAVPIHEATKSLAAIGKKFSVGSRAGNEVTVVEATGIDTKNAIAIGVQLGDDMSECRSLCDQGRLRPRHGLSARLRHPLFFHKHQEQRMPIAVQRDFGRKETPPMPVSRSAGKLGCN
jgi:hypothetical protein